MLYVLTIRFAQQNPSSEMSYYLGVLAKDVCGYPTGFGDVEILPCLTDIHTVAAVIRAPKGIDIGSLTGNFGEARMLYGEDNVRFFRYP